MSALICLTYDDALSVHREQVAFDLEKRGLHGTFYVPAARDDLFTGLDGWRKVAAMGHELGNHSCWHPCRGRADWLPRAYQMEDYDRRRMCDELLLANRLLYLIDGCTERSFGATCGHLTCGPDEGESFVDDIRNLFTLVRSGHSDGPLSGPMPFVAPLKPVDYLKADEIIATLALMRDLPDAWMIVGMHGVGVGTHDLFMETDQHRRLIDWIAAQSAWLEGVTMLEAAARRGLEPNLI